jgi:hypothetical protein
MSKPRRKAGRTLMELEIVPRAERTAQAHQAAVLDFGADGGPAVF